MVRSRLTNTVCSVTPGPAGRCKQGRALRTARTSSASASVDSPDRTLKPDQILAFERRGHVQLAGLLPSCAVEHVAADIQQVVAARQLEALRHRVRVLCSKQEARACKTAEQARATLRRARTDVGFLQFFNLWRHLPSVFSLAHDARLTSVAAQLLGTRRLRLYQDCVFVKYPGYAETNWHSDLRMMPLDTNSAVTAWVPCRAMSGKSDSGLQFASGSHRDFAAAFWRDLSSMDLASRGYQVTQPARMEVGDVSFHHGWTLHTAPAQSKNSQARTALSFTYFADGSRLLPRRDATVRKEYLHDEDYESYADWIGDLPDGGIARHKLLPAVFPFVQPSGA